MSNMSYCRFENTLKDLRDCADALYDKGLTDYYEDASDYERPAILKLINLAKEIVEEYYDEAQSI